MYSKLRIEELSKQIKDIELNQRDLETLKQEVTAQLEVAEHIYRNAESLQNILGGIYELGGSYANLDLPRGIGKTELMVRYGLEQVSETTAVFLVVNTNSALQDIEDRVAVLGCGVTITGLFYAGTIDALHTLSYGQPHCGKPHTDVDRVIILFDDVKDNTQGKNKLVSTIACRFTAEKLQVIDLASGGVPDEK